ncbi:MAG: T9SS type A sorting domain-containing protein [Armatimonadota bacterium]
MKAASSLVGGVTLFAYNGGGELLLTESMGTSGTSGVVSVNFDMTFSGGGGGQLPTAKMTTKENNSDHTGTTWTPEVSSSHVKTEQVAGGTKVIWCWHWDTTQVHNGDHEIKVNLYSSPEAEEPFYTSDPPESITIKNLSITSPEGDYLVWNPGGTSDTEISYTLEDDGSTANTSVEVKIYNMAGQCVRTDSATGGSYEWNGEDDGEESQDKGIYLYKLTASHTNSSTCNVCNETLTATDTYCNKSDWTIGDITVQMLSYDEGTGSMKVGYKITPDGCGATTATSAAVVALNPGLASCGSTSQSNPVTVENQPTNSNLFPNFDVTFGDPGYWTFLVSGVDKDPTHNRNHVDEEDGGRLIWPAEAPWAHGADVDLDVSDDENEDSPGMVVVRNCDGNGAGRKAITLPNAGGSFSGNLILSRNNSKLKVYDALTGGNEITFNGTDNKFPNSSLPKTLYVEGYEASDSTGDAVLTLQAENAANSDSVSFTVLWVTITFGVRYYQLIRSAKARFGLPS